MKNRVLVLLIVLALAAVSGIGLASAQSSTMIKVVTLGETNVYAEASADAEVAATLPVSSVVEVLGVEGDFFMVDGGYVMASDVAVMNLPALAPKAVVSTSSAGATALLASPNVSGDIVTTLDDGTVATVLAANGQLAFVESAGQYGWSVATDWEVAPESFGTAMISLGNTDQVGVFAEASINADIVGTLTEGDQVYVYEDSGETMVNVMLADGTMGYVQRQYLGVLPSVWADTVAGSNANPALFDQPDFSGNVLAALPVGAVVTVIADVDDFWAEVYYAPAGVGYILKTALSNVYTVATVQEANSLVRDGAGEQYYPVAQLNAGDKVLVKGIEGEWFNVAIPYEKYFAFNAKEPYMFGDLLANAASEYDFDITLFTGAAEAE